eukprot:jgi/Ulvmu1/2853/UM145_0008.1
MSDDQPVSFVAQARERNRISQTKYRRRLKGLAAQLSDVLASRREALVQARILQGRHREDNRQLHKTLAAVTDTLLQLSRSVENSTGSKIDVVEDASTQVGQARSAVLPTGFQALDGTNAARMHHYESAKSMPVSAGMPTASEPHSTHRSDGVATAVVEVCEAPMRSQATFTILDVLPQQVKSPGAQQIPYACAVAAERHMDKPAPPTTAAQVSATSLQTVETILQQQVMKMLTQRRSVAAAGTTQRHTVHPSLQTPFRVDATRSLSFSTDLISPSCWTSFYASYFSHILECCFLAAVMQSSPVVKPAEDDDTASEDSSQDQSPRSARLGGGGFSARSACLGAFKLEHWAADEPAADTTAFMRLHQAMPDPSDCNLLLTCGRGGLAPVATAVPHIVHEMCDRYRRHLSSAEWLQTRDAFARLVQLHCGHVLSPDGCPHHTHGPHAAADAAHRPSACPCCAVLCVTATSLQHYIEKHDVAGAQKFAVEAMPAAEAEARVAEVVGCSSVAAAQCLQGHPLALRSMYHQLWQQKSGSDSAYCSSLLYFQDLQLQRGQQQQLAALWQLWKQSRSSLDAKFRAALEPLLKISTIADVAARCPCAHRVGTVDSAAVDPGRDVLPHAAPMWATDGFCACAACSQRLSRRVLGASAAAHSTAGAVMRRLRDVLNRDGAAFTALMQTAGVPGLLLSAKQVAQHMPLAVQHGVPFVDWLLVCRIAHEDLNRRVLMAEFA